MERSDPLSMKTQPRRSQEERSAATRERLLNATIDCLVESGFAGTTTTEVVKRAGVSRGAQVHHYPTKAELVQSAIEHLSARQGEELRREYEALSTKKDTLSTAIDLLWTVYTGPMFVAGMELIVGARTDPELRPALTTLQNSLSEGLRTSYRQIAGPNSVNRGAWRDVFELTIALMHGLALRKMLDVDQEGREERLIGTWKRLIKPLLEEKGHADE